MESLVGIKVWLNNDIELVKQVEQFAFKNGFGWLKSNWNFKTKKYDNKLSFTSITLKKVYALYFLESNEGLKFIAYKLKYTDTISTYYSHKDRFDNSINMNQNFMCNNKNLPLKEVSVQELLKNENNWLWN